MTDDIGQFDEDGYAIEELKSRIDAMEDMRDAGIEQGDEALVEFCTGRISGLYSGISVLRKQQSDTGTDNINGEEIMNESLDIERNWIAVKGDEIKSLADSKERARRVAEHLGREYDEIIATPAGGVPHVI